MGLEEFGSQSKYITVVFHLPASNVQNQNTAGIMAMGIKAPGPKGRLHKSKLLISRWPVSRM